MKIELKPPYAESYSLEMPEGKEEKISIYEKALKLLKENHPGFTSESLWDYGLCKAGGKKYLLAAVLDRDFYMEKRLLKNRTIFYVQKSDFKKNLFAFYKFTVKGQRIKNRRIFVFSVLLILVIFLAFILFYLKTDKKITEEIPQVVEKEISEIPNVIEQLNMCAHVINTLGGKISSVIYNADSKNNILFQVSEGTSLKIVDELLKTGTVKECSISQIIYDGEKQKFEIKACVDFTIPHQLFTDENSMLVLREEVLDKLKESGACPVSSLTDSDSGIITMTFEADRKSLAGFNASLGLIAVEKNLFITSLSETRQSEKQICVISLEFIQIDKEQIIGGAFVEDSLSKVLFEPEKDIPKTPVKEVDKTGAEKKMTAGYTKIGSIRKKGKLLFYYRTEEGKIIVSEEEL